MDSYFFGVVFTTYVIFTGIVIYRLFHAGCGMDDGPFKAILIEPIEISDSAQVYLISRNGRLVIENRNDSLSPIIMLLENEEIKWALDTDVGITEVYELDELWEISDVEIFKDRRKIKLNFIGDWTMGAERGYMEIKRRNGENCFCLSW